MGTEAEVLTNPGFITSFPGATVFCNITRIFENVFSDSPMNQKLRSAKSGNETKVKRNFRTHCTTVLAQLELCNVANYSFKSSAKIN